MRLKLFWVGILSTFMLFGCTNLNDEGLNDRNVPDDNIQPTRYNDGTNNRTNNMRDGNRIRNVNDNRMDRNNNINNDRMNNGNNGNNQYEVSKEAAERIVDEIKEIDYAYVLTTDNNAYVAATMDGQDNNNRANTRNINNRDNNNGDEVADDVKNKIADIVQSVDADIDNVFVSTNPDFVDLTQNYADNLDNGRPVRGFLDQMGNMIERVFPQNKR